MENEELYDLIEDFMSDLHSNNQCDMLFNTAGESMVENFGETSQQSTVCNRIPIPSDGCFTTHFPSTSHPEFESIQHVNLNNTTNSQNRSSVISTSQIQKVSLQTIPTCHPLNPCGNAAKKKPPQITQVTPGIPTLYSDTTQGQIIPIEKVNNYRPAVTSVNPIPPPNSKTVRVQLSNPFASMSVKRPISIDPKRKFISVLIKPQPTKTTTQIQAATKCTNLQIRRTSDQNSGPSFPFVFTEKSSGADSGLESSDDSNKPSLSPPINPETSVSLFDPRKKKVVGCISFQKFRASFPSISLGQANKIPIASNSRTCNILPSSLDLINAYQPLTQNLPTNTQTLKTPISADHGIVWPATLSDNSCTKQHLSSIAPTMEANPEPKVLSPNFPTAFDLQRRSTCDSQLPPNNKRRPAILRKYPPSKKTTLANQHNPPATIPVTMRIPPLENSQPRLTTTQIQGPEKLTITSKSSFSTLNRENPVHNSGILVKTITDRPSNIIDHLGLVTSRVENAIAGNASLRQFGDAILEYKDLFLESMEISLTNASKKSRQDVERVIGIAENHWLVQPNRLEIWIKFKTAELVMFGLMSQVDGVTFLANENHLNEEMASLKNAIVLFIPSLDEWSIKIMKEFENLDPFTTASDLPMEDPEPWHLNEERQNHVFQQVCQLIQHSRSDTSEQWKCFIAFEDNGGNCGHFSIYKGKQVLKRNLKNLSNELSIQPTLSGTSK